MNRRVGLRYRSYRSIRLDPRRVTQFSRNGVHTTKNTSRYRIKPDHVAVVQPSPAVLAWQKAYVGACDQAQLEWCVEDLVWFPVVVRGDGGADACPPGLVNTYVLYLRSKRMSAEWVGLGWVGCSEGSR